MMVFAKFSVGETVLHRLYAEKDARSWIITHRYWSAPDIVYELKASGLRCIRVIERDMTLTLRSNDERSRVVQRMSLAH